MGNQASELRQQWINPGDILSLLLLVGGDVIRKAIAQLVGHRIQFLGNQGPKLPVAPVAFSFGWVAYGFSNLLSAAGNRTLMPAPEHPSLVVNCANGFARDNASWVLSRLLQDHEVRSRIDVRQLEEGGLAESIRIDVFSLGPTRSPNYDSVWWFGWMTIVAQIGIATLPWILYDGWGVMMVALSGNLLAAITCALPQWTQEKWAGRKLKADKVVSLTRGNGYHHIMVFVCTEGSWDLESLASGFSVSRPETRWISLVLAILWVCLLIGVCGLKDHAWFLVGIGGLGMLQNIYAAGTSRKPGTTGLHIVPSVRAPTIIGRRKDYKDDSDASIDLDRELRDLAEVSHWASGKSNERSHEEQISTDINTSRSNTMPQWIESMASVDGAPVWLEPIKPENGTVYAVGVHGALMELEKWVPTAGLANVQLFFPAGLSYCDERIRNNIHKKFWKRAYHTADVRKKAEQRRRADEMKKTKNRAELSQATHEEQLGNSACQAYV
jgi:hypothetical protein